MTASTPAQQTLLQALRELRPATLLSLSCAGTPAIDTYRNECKECEVLELSSPEELDALAQGKRFEWGVICGIVETVPAARARELIAALRDRYCDGLLLLVPKAHWPFNDYLALGFELRSSCGGPREACDLYWYQVDRYNPERDWNNPDDWANPENFKRFRW